MTTANLQEPLDAEPSHRGPLLLGALALGLLIWFAIPPSMVGRPPGPIRIVGKNFLESAILAELMAQSLLEAGYPVDPIDYPRIPNAEFLTGLDRGDIDLYPEYSSTLVVQLLGQDPSVSTAANHGDPEWVRSILQAEQSDLTWLTPFQYSSNYQPVMLRPRAEELGLLSDGTLRLSELAANAPGLTLGASPDFFRRRDALPGLIKAYPGIELMNHNIDKHELLYERMRDQRADVGIAYTTDPELSENPALVRVEDDRSYFLDYRPAPLARKDVLVAYPGIERVLLDLSTRIDLKAMLDLHQRADEAGLALDDLRESVVAQRQLQTLVREFLRSNPE
ncbi:MAG: glycine betaine ABC transporter substrate-binding protein [Myxococcota bacterium]